MGSSCVPLVDVNVSTADTTWPLLMNAISNADFVSIDLELSGIGRVSSSKTRSMEDHYQSLSAVVTSRAILSLGLACFKWSKTGPCSTGPVPLKVEVYNVWLLTQQPFVMDPTSAQFLVNHGFDFNKQYSKGLPYLPPAARTEASPSPPPQYCLDSVLACLLDHAIPVVFHNGWLDILFLYHSFYGPLPPTSAALMADLTEMFPRGVYDTKAIAQFQCFEEASFLEYVFRICQHRNTTACTENQSHLELHFSMQTRSDDFIECVEISVPPSIPTEQLLLIPMCRSFSDHGYCNNPDCMESHDILVSIQLQAGGEGKLRKKRKRKKRREKTMNKKLKLEASVESCDSDVTPETGSNGTCDSHVTQETGCVDISQLFQSELASAKAKLQDGQRPSQNKTRSSLGHRAGLDAFMTGYAFACYALCSRNKDAEEPLAGLADMKNCLPSRARNWKVPLHILKSHFVKTSATHSIAKERMKQLASELHLQQHN